MGFLTTQLRRILRMRQILMAILVLLAAVVAFTSFTSGAYVTSERSTAGDPKKAEACAKSNLVGTWKQIKARFGGKAHNIPEGTVQLKHITQTHYMFVDIDKDGIIVDARGGPYTLKGEMFESTPEYGISEAFKALKGKPQVFQCKVEGDKWYHSGTLTNGLTIEEVWERVEPK
jgi:hypothetical protein